MSAERGWIGEPQPPSRTYAPGEEHKWRLMMGNGQFWHMPGWLGEKGTGRSHFHTAKTEDENHADGPKRQ